MHESSVKYTIQGCPKNKPVFLWLLTSLKCVNQFPSFLVTNISINWHLFIYLFFCLFIYLFIFSASFSFDDVILTLTRFGPPCASIGLFTTSINLDLPVDLHSVTMIITHWNNTSWAIRHHIAKIAQHVFISDYNFWKISSVEAYILSLCDKGKMRLLTLYTSGYASFYRTEHRELL